MIKVILVLAAGFCTHAPAPQAPAATNPLPFVLPFDPFSSLLNRIAPVERPSHFCDDEQEDGVDDEPEKCSPPVDCDGMFDRGSDRLSQCRLSI